MCIENEIYRNELNSLYKFIELYELSKSSPKQCQKVKNYWNSKTIHPNTYQSSKNIKQQERLTSCHTPGMNNDRSKPS